MSAPLPTSAAEIASAIESLLQEAMPTSRDVAVSGLAPLFGGNARKAWSFDVTWVADGKSVATPCVMLSQVGGRQVESDVRWEFKILSRLNGTGVRAPRAIAMDADGRTVGAPSIVLERLPGKTDVLGFLKSDDVGNSTALTEDLAAVVARFHDVEWNAAELSPALAETTPRQIVLNQILHWENVYRTNRLEPLPVVAALFSWLKSNMPEPARIRLVHGDLRPGNFLYAEGRVTGLLDWEMAHLGDPIEDLGWIYRPLWSPERFVRFENFVTIYERHAGCAVPRQAALFYRVFSELKFVAISLTAANAFFSGRTGNLRHADRAATVGPCLKLCLDLIEEYERGARHV